MPIEDFSGWSTVTVDDQMGVKFGFTSDKFKASSFISMRGNAVRLSFVLPRDEEYRTELIERITAMGFEVVSTHL